MLVTARFLIWLHIWHLTCLRFFNPGLDPRMNTYAIFWLEIQTRLIAVPSYLLVYKVDVIMFIARVWGKLMERNLSWLPILNWEKTALSLVDSSGHSCTYRMSLLIPKIEAHPLLRY